MVVRLIFKREDDCIFEVEKELYTLLSTRLLLKFKYGDWCDEVPNLTLKALNLYKM